MKCSICGFEMAMLDLNTYACVNKNCDNCLQIPAELPVFFVSQGAKHRIDVTVSPVWDTHGRLKEISLTKKGTL